VQGVAGVKRGVENRANENQQQKSALVDLQNDDEQLPSKIP